MSETVALSDATDLRPRLSHVARVVDTFLAPSRTFEDILQSTSWWLPFLLAAIFSSATAYVIEKKVGFDTVSQNLVHDNPAQEERMSSLEPKQRTAQLHAMTVGTRYSTYAAPCSFFLSPA